MAALTPAEFAAGRKALGMSTAALAEWLGLELPNGERLIRAWESGKKPISGPAARAMQLAVDRTPTISGVSDMNQMIDLKPCRECGAPCRIESFGPSEHIEGIVRLWICSNHKRFGGDCPSDLAYFDAEAWNEGVPAYNPDERLREALEEARGELVRLRARYGTAHSEVVISHIDTALSPLPQGEDT